MKYDSYGRENFNVRPESLRQELRQLKEKLTALEEAQLSGNRKKLEELLGDHAARDYPSVYEELNLKINNIRGQLEGLE